MGPYGALEPFPTTKEVGKGSLTAEAVAHALEEVLAQAANAGKAATVTALADRLGVQRQSLYRDFTPSITEFLAPDAERRISWPRPPKDLATDRETIARLRREKDELIRHLHIYEDHIRRLTIENAKLTAELAQQRGVARLADRRPLG